MLLIRPEKGQGLVLLEKLPVTPGVRRDSRDDSLGRKLRQHTEKPKGDGDIPVDGVRVGS